MYVRIHPYCLLDLRKIFSAFVALQKTVILTSKEEKPLWYDYFYEVYFIQKPDNSEEIHSVESHESNFLVFEVKCSLTVTGYFTIIIILFLFIRVFCI